MKKAVLGPAALFVFVLAAFLASFVFSSPAESATASEEARTLQMIASYRSWGKANVQPIIVSLEQMAPSG
jgi:L-asparagine transporter-like permease